MKPPKHGWLLHLWRKWRNPHVSPNNVLVYSKICKTKNRKHGWLLRLWHKWKNPHVSLDNKLIYSQIKDNADKNKTNI